MPRPALATDTKSTPKENPSASSGWGDPAVWLATDAPLLAVGSVIKDRFVLEEPIGSGGMGTVFKARDLRKVEAQDRNPFVAIKLLNEEFRRHPQSLQALQRESRKTQKLAHPNIVTVYDFDRDGANVYMVMELLEGEPLDRLIRRTTEVGVGLREALRITQAICRAMAYAHEQGIVHSDFKPANAFLTQEHTVKVLDFGIARAAKHSEDSTGERTLFDPGNLGALTPAYAGCEVIEGQEADARDDIYAIACVTYELITGRHPFNRLSAAQAREAALTPEPPRGLSKRQWRTLRCALSFRRDPRPKSATEFFEGLRPLRRTPVVYAAVGGASIAAAIIAMMLVSGQIQKYRDRSLSRALASAEASRIEPLLPQLHDFDPARRASVFLEDAARTGLVKYFQKRIDVLVDARAAHYDYPAAESLLRELETLLPDSQAVQDLYDHLTARKTEELKRESAAFESDLQHGWLLATQNRENIQSLLAIAAHVDPHNPLLHDSRLPTAFAEGARQAIQRGETPLAASLVAAGLIFDPRDGALIELRAQVTPSPASTPASQSPANTLQTQITDALAQPVISLPQVRTLAEAAEDLTRHGDPRADTLTLQLKTGLAHSAVQLEATRGLDVAIQFAEGAYALFPESHELRDTLVQLRVAATERASKQHQESIAATQKKIESLSTHVNDAWITAFDRELRRLRSLLPASDPYLEQARSRAASLFLSQASALRAQQHLPEARRLLDVSAHYSPDTPGFAQEEQLLAAAERTARVGALEQKLLERAQAGDIAEALSALGNLGALLPANDSFLAHDGPGAIAAAYLRQAAPLSQEGRFTEALDFVNKARATAPWLGQLASARVRYIHYQALDQYLTGRDRIDTRQVRGDLAGFVKQDQGEAMAATQGLLHNLMARINSTPDPRLSDRLLQAAKEIFGNDSVARVSSPTSAAASK
jgi:serine/threonine protein kinase